MVGRRWTLLILRDLLVGPQRYSDPAGALPGNPSHLLSTRMTELAQSVLISPRPPSSSSPPPTAAP
ncbi:winged helix-turn-helix transcriptional regulator [Nesterenkonia sp. K-15-9-6]|uniref:winged helix-turn-helix transcriptional regulator n=1 Tax=Nesterenkonia sp. K-15-9-6 TaxID=3093918 RepID=UPI004044CFEA